jgi:pSer/pThr/pTyr-binding forkhead associated (FHA) protein
VFLLDHGSTNGTYVNDAALAPDQQCELQDGDRVRLGLFNLIVKII